MANRHEIARRHGIPNLADQLVGETAAELEADAAARAALMSMFGSLKSAEAPEAEEVSQTQDRSDTNPLPPADKPFTDYTDAEWAAVHAESERKLAERQEPAEEPVVPEGLNPLHEQLGYTRYDLGKAERDAALVRSIHSGGDE